jgi:hypothetical protein
MLLFQWRLIKLRVLIIFLLNLHCWEVVKKGIMHLFLCFHNGSLDVQRLNYGIIILLSKSCDANKIHQFRPICLLRCIYKLITKTLIMAS